MLMLTGSSDRADKSGVILRPCGFYQRFFNRRIAKIVAEFAGSKQVRITKLALNPRYMASPPKSLKPRLAMSRTAAGLIVVAALALVSGRSHAAEITGTVRAVSGNPVTVAIEGEILPSVGDKTEILFKVPGADEPISVATGKVEKVDGASVQVKIENAIGTIEDGLTKCKLRQSEEALLS